MFRFRFSLVILSVFFFYTSGGKELKIEKPNYEMIKTLTHDNTSAYYYPALYKRYIANDTTLKQADYTMLYYGYLYQAGYKATGQNSVYNDSLRGLLNQEHITKGEWKKIISYLYKYIDDFPFDLEKLNILFIAFHNLNDEYYSIKYRNKLEMLIKTILATGDGKTSATGYHVLKIDDEYALLSVLGYEYEGKQTQTPDHCDYLLLGKNPEGVEGLYFDVKQIFANQH